VGESKKDANWGYAAVSRTGLIARQNGKEAYRKYEIRRGDTDILISNLEETKPTINSALGELEDATPSVGHFTPDGRTFVVFNRGIRVFETYSGQELFSVPNRTNIRAIAFSPDGRTLWTSHGSNDEDGSYGTTQVEGWDLTGGEWRPIIRGLDLEALKFGMNGTPTSARRAMYQFSQHPAEAIAFVKELTKSPSMSDTKQFETWMEELDAPAFALRDAATKGLAKAGWRVEGALQLLLSTTSSLEVRHRLEKLLRHRDMRPLRSVQLLELIRTPEAIEVLRDIANGPAESLVSQDARWALQRLTNARKR
jgi:hypothetical protein